MIQWTEDTLNSLLGCFMCSPGCYHCYAIDDLWRMGHNPKLGIDDSPYAGLVEKHPVTGKRNWTGRIRFLPHKLYAVLRQKRSRMYFVNSLSDLFYERLPQEIILEHFRIFGMAYWHQFQVLTKRSERLVQLSPQIPWPENVWMGVSVERAESIYRIADLGKTDAHLKFISFEPWLSGARRLREQHPDLRSVLQAAGIDWAIIGGESSKRKDQARFMDLDDVRYLIEECRGAGVKIFLKQLGTRWAVDSNTYGAKGSDGKRAEEVNAGGNPAFWPAEFRDPQLREHPAVSNKPWAQPHGIYPSAMPTDWKKWATPEMETPGNPKHANLVRIADLSPAA